MTLQVKPTAFIHTSDIRMFKQCRYAWLLGSPLMGNYVPLNTPRYFVKGRASHAALEEYYRTREDPAEKYFEIHTDIIVNDATRGMKVDTPEYSSAVSEALGFDYVGEDLEMGERVMEEYIHWASQHEDFEKILSIEQNEKVPLLTHEEMPPGSKFHDAVFSFRTDLIVKRRKGQTWLIDFKTTSQMPSYEQLRYLDNDEQLSGYLAGCERKYNTRFAGAMFIFILMKLPKDPIELQSGDLSLNKQQQTSVYRYSKAIRDLGLDRREYATHLEYLRENKIWVRPIENIRTEDEKRKIWETHKLIAYEMLRPDVYIYTAPSNMNCRTCSYFDPCLANNAGLDEDVASQLKHNYAIAGPREGDPVQ